MDLNLRVLRREVKQFRSTSVRITERLLALIEVAKRSGPGGELSELESERISVQFAISARTLRRWVAAYGQGAVEGITPRRNPGRKANHIRGFTAKKITEYRRLYHWGAEVIAAHLEHDYGVKVGRFRIHRFLKRKGLLFSPKRKQKSLSHTRVVQVAEPGKHTQTDVKYLTKLLRNETKCYVYTFIDHASRWRFKRAYDSFGPSETKDFMQRLLLVVPFVIARLQTDNGVEFTNKYISHIDKPRQHALDKLCEEMGIRHVLIPPGEKELQGLVERNHRQDDDELYHRISPHDVAALNRELDKHSRWCNSRRRRKALAWKTSNEFLTHYQSEGHSEEHQPAAELTETLIVPIKQAA
jgi:transposase InsO family protein